MLLRKKMLKHAIFYINLSFYGMLDIYIRMGRKLFFQVLFI